MRTRSILLASLLLAGAGGLAQAQAPAWNRAVEGVAVVPRADGLPGHDVHVFWSATLHAPVPDGLDLSADLVIVANGQEIHREPTLVIADAGAGGCGSCSPGCGTGAVNGMAAALICGSDGPAGCSCKFPPLKARTTADLPPGSQVVAFLAPAKGAVPEIVQADDRRVVVVDEKPVWWDRRIEEVAVKPAAKGNGKQDVHVSLGVVADGGLDPLALGFVVEVIQQAQVIAHFQPPCGPWILVPDTTCKTMCDASLCSKLVCNGVTVVELRCRLVENAWNQMYCACVSDPYALVVPDVDLLPGVPFEIALKPAPGALPEIPVPTLEKDVLSVCAPAAALEYGAGKPGTNGTPRLAAQDLPILGEPLTLQLSNAAPNTFPVLFLGTTPAALPFDQGTLLVTPQAILPLPVATNADGKLELGGVVPTGALPCGASLHLQMMLKDEAAQGPHHTAQSNGLQLTFGL